MRRGRRRGGGGKNRRSGSGAVGGSFLGTFTLNIGGRLHKARHGRGRFRGFRLRHRRISRILFRDGGKKSPLIKLLFDNFFLTKNQRVGMILQLGKVGVVLRAAVFVDDLNNNLPLNARFLGDLVDAFAHAVWFAVLGGKKKNG